MRALLVKGPGEAPVVGEIADPVLTDPEEILVHVQAASLSRLDSYVARGVLRDVLEHLYPVVLGWDFTGVVAQVGTAVEGFAAGDPVMGILHRTVLQAGTVAEQVLMPVTDYTLAHRPAGVDVPTAAAVPFAARSALCCIDAAKPRAGQRVLVIGACGGVGGFAVQFAARTGASVVAAGCDQDAAYLRSLGAAEIADFHDLPARLGGHFPDGIDVVIDTVSAVGEAYPENFAAATGLVRPGGRVVSTGMIADVGAGLERGVHAVNLMADIHPAYRLDEVARLLDSGGMQAPRLHVADLDEAPDALKRLEVEHTVGKYVIRIAGA